MSGSDPKSHRFGRKRLMPSPKRMSAALLAHDETASSAIETPRPAVEIGSSARLSEAEANTRAVVDAVQAIIRAHTIGDIIKSTLEVVRREFGWSYGSYWTIDPAKEALVFSQESGTVDEEFSRVTRSSQFREGEGLSGRAWKKRDLVHVEDLGTMEDCSRAPVARRAGVRSGVAMPILLESRVIGTMDFFSSEEGIISPDRIAALRVISQLASDKVTNLSKQIEMVRLNRMIENTPSSMMFADRDLKIRYMNPASYKLLRQLEAYLPCKADDMIGQTIDIFHRASEHQRTILADLADPKNLPLRTIIRIGPEHADLLVSAIMDADGNYLGPMLTWDLVTEKIVSEAREAELAVDTNAVNLLLIAMGRAKSIKDVVTSALSTVREAFGWSYAIHWSREDDSLVMKRAQDSGSVADEFRRTIAEAEIREGEDLVGQAWRTRDLVVASDLADTRVLQRGGSAQRAKLKSAVCLPIVRNGIVVSALEFFSEQAITPSENRLETLRNVGRLVSSAVERTYQQTQIDLSKRDLEIKVNQLMKVAQAAALGDLTMEVEVKGSDDMGRLGEAIGKMTFDLKGVISQVIETASQFAEGSRIVAESASYLSESSQNQAATVEEMSASIDHLSKAILDINQNASAARELADRTSQLAKQGGDSVDQAIEAMVLIRKSSEQVSDIIQVISEIASQTNLLALNAAIEAARAGEHGLGFAVVADEVRKLAERSRAAAKEITALIKESTRRVADGAQLSEKAGESLATIVKGVEETAASISKIARATQEQSESASEVGRAIQNVSSIIETNASSSEELSASAEQLGAQAGVLKQVISGFKV